MVSAFLSLRQRRSPTRNGAGAVGLRLLAAILLAVTSLTAAPSAAQQSYASFVREANERTVRLIAGAPGETSLDVAHDLAEVLHCVDGLRIVPIAGRGDKNNIYDLLFLKGVDMAIVRADVLDYAERNAIFLNDLKERIVYVSPLFQEEVHLIADSSITQVQDLSGKFVNIGPPGTLGLAAKAVLQAAGVSVVESKFDHALALERVIDGTLDAMFIVGGKPIPMLSELSNVPGLRLVPIRPLGGDSPYQPATFEHSDYATLVRAGGQVETIAAPSILTLYNWPSDRPQYAKNELFTEAFFKRLSYLRRPARHPKWGETRLTQGVGGWTRFQPAQDRADVLSASLAAAAEAIPRPVALTEEPGVSREDLEAMFQKQLDDFGIVPPSDEEREQLFLAFKRRFETTNR